MRIKDVEGLHEAHVHSDDTMADVAKQLKKHGIGALPVCDEADQLIGIVADREIAIHCTAQGHDPNKCLVSSAMTRRFVVADPDTDLRHAADMMSKERIKWLPVVDDAILVGMVSLAQINAKLRDTRSPMVLASPDGTPKATTSCECPECHTVLSSEFVHRLHHRVNVRFPCPNADCQAEMFGLPGGAVVCV
jgi:CBS-domain-containing membrane protein